MITTIILLFCLFFGKKIVKNVRKIFKKEEPEHHMDSVTYMTDCAEGFRVNEELLGRIIAYKKRGDLYDSTNMVCVQSSVERPVDFGTNLFRWLVVIKAERKSIIEKMTAQELAEKENKLKDKEERAKKALAERRDFLDNFFKPLSQKN